MALKFKHWLSVLVLISLICAFLLSVLVVNPGLAQSDSPDPAIGGIPAVTENAYGLILGAALIVAVIFVGVALRRWKS
jgi:hypothetical protein